MPNRRVFHLARASLDGPHHNLSGVKSDPDLEWGAALGSQPARYAFYVLLNTERGQQRTLRMVLVRNRCTEKRENAVASRLHNVTVVAMDRVDHHFERRIDNLTRVLGVEVLH